VNDSTLSGNISKFGGGGINNLGGDIVVSNSTLTNNIGATGGGINNRHSIEMFGEIRKLGVVTVNNTIIAGNTSPNGPEVWNEGIFISNGYNLFGHGGSSGLFGVATVTTDILPTVTIGNILAPLGDYGGSTKTHALLQGSPAIGAGDPALTTPDQRGESRVGIADIGAFESKFIPVEPTPLPTPIETTPQPTESVKPPTDRTNLEAKEIRKSLPSIVLPESILCVQRSDGNTISNQDPYQGVPICGTTTTQGKAIAPQTQRIDR
jgi:hypothetical protein